MLAAATASANQIDDAIQDLGKENTPAQFAAVRTIMTAGAPAAPQLAKNLTNSNPAIRKKCISLLRQIKDRTNYAAIKDRALNDSEWLVREQAIVALSDYKSSDTATTLLQIAGKDPIVNNRVSSVRYLSHIAGPNSTQGLRQIFKNDADIVVRLNAARELALYGDKSGSQLAHASIHDSNWAARYAAAGTLGYLGDPKDTQALDQVASDPKEEGSVRYAAYSSSQHIQLVQKSDSDQLETLKPALADSDPRTRRWAATELYTRKDDQTRAFLRRVVDNPRHPGRAEAISILAAQRQPE